MKAKGSSDLPDTKFLLTDTSTSCTAFAVSHGNELIHIHTDCSKNSADTMAYEIHKLMNKHNVSPDDFTALSVANGPGSFTGLRIGLSFAKGFCMASGCRLILISSLDILAQSLGPETGEFIVAIDTGASSGEMYFAVYERLSGLSQRLTDYGLSDDQNFGIPGMTVVRESGSAESSFSFGISKNKLASQLLLTLDHASKGNYADVDTSEPFYMKEFTIRK